MSTIKVSVANVEQVADAIKRFTFVAADGGNLPLFSGGSHIVVEMMINGRVHRNPYSLMSNPEERSHYQISVLKQSSSRGGSVFMHEQVEVGTQLTISYPTNLFSISKLAKKHILVAGGIGITPFISHIHDLNRLGADYELHYAYRSPKAGAFRDSLQNMATGNAHFYVTSQDQVLDFTQLLAVQPLGTHVYVCGPESMVSDLINTARSLGWPEKHIHSEQFLSPKAGDAFSIKLAQSNIEVEVPGEMSMLEAIEGAGVNAPYLCRGGACGRCELEVLECDGVLLHNDHYLTDSEKNSGKKIMPCVSRAKCKYMVVNI